MSEEKVNNNNYVPEPPKAIEAEKAVLGSMMKNPDAVMDVIDILRPEDFYLKEHQLIFETMLDMHRKSVAIDMMTTYTALNDKKLAEIVGGYTYLSKLVSDAIVSSNAKYYAETVIAKSRMRSLIVEAEKIRDSAYDGEKSAEAILDTAEQRILEIAQRSQNKNYRDINDVINDDIEIIQEIQKNGKEIQGITTGFRTVDKLLGGLHKTDLIVLAARPGMGKTAFALNVAMNAAKAGNKVIIFSLEMSDTQLGMRMLSMEAKVDMGKLNEGSLTQEDWGHINKAQDKFEESVIKIDENPTITVTEMKNKCRRFKAENGLDLIIIDYLQLMQIVGKAESREKEIAALTRSIKIMAKELNCAVLLLSQLSRSTEKNGSKDKVPKLSDLRDSGAIEQDADIVIFLKRDDYYDDEAAPADIQSNTSKTCEVHVAKHRNGQTGICELAWIGKFTKFDNLERMTPEPPLTFEED